MSKREKTEGYSVIVFVPVRENQPECAYRVGGAPDDKEALRYAHEISNEIIKHVGPDYIAARRPEIEPQIVRECEHCAYAWHGTAEDPDYNGGCCSIDEGEHQARKNEVDPERERAAADRLGRALGPIFK